MQHIPFRPTFSVLVCIPHLSSSEQQLFYRTTFDLYRSNTAYRRFWEARTQLDVFSGKLTDAVIVAMTLDRNNIAMFDLGVTKGEDKLPIDELKIGHKRFKHVLIHLTSLLHAVALATLRNDQDLRNIIVRILPMLFT